MASSRVDEGIVCQKNAGAATHDPRDAESSSPSNFRPPFLSAFRPALWSFLSPILHIRRESGYVVHTHVQKSVRVPPVCPPSLCERASERKREREREKSSCAPAFISHDFHESYAGDDELFLVTGGRAGAARRQKTDSNSRR